MFPIHWFICGVWLHWINMSNARLEIKTQRGCFIWMYLWRKPTVFKKVSLAFSFYLIKLRSWAELLRLQPLLWKPLVLPLSQRLLLAENQIAFSVRPSPEPQSTFHTLYPGWSTFVPIYKNNPPTLPVKSFWTVQFLMILLFFKNSLLLTKPAFIWSKVQQKQLHFEIFLLFKNN